MALIFGGNNVSPVNKLGFGNEISLASGQTWMIQPAGTYWVAPGKYTCLQVFDPVLNTWRTVGGGIANSSVPHYIQVDANNYRLANLTGCTVGALITNKGSGYVSAPTVTISGQNSIWRAVVGGQVGTITVSNGGSNYTYAPAVTFSSPPVNGIQATGYATISGGAVTTVTLTNVGGGYTSPPTLTFVNDSREGQNGVTAGYNAAAVCALTGAGTVSGIICVDPGSGGLTSVPSFTFAGGGGGSALAATVICCFTITAFTPGGTNTGWGTTLYPLLTGLDSLGEVALVSGVTNPETQQNLVKTRPATIGAYAATTSLANTGSIFYDGGIYTGVPNSLVIPTVAMFTGSLPAATTVAYSVGGVADTSYISS